MQHGDKIYIAEDMATTPLLSGSRDDVAILPLSPGAEYRVFASAVDNVGNRIPPQQQMDNYVLINYPITASRCISDCSGRGNCTVYATCECDPGYYGNDCSQGNISTDIIMLGIIIGLDKSCYQTKEGGFEGGGGGGGGGGRRREEKGGGKKEREGRGRGRGERRKGRGN